MFIPDLPLYDYPASHKCDQVAETSGMTGDLLLALVGLGRPRAV